MHLTKKGDLPEERIRRRTIKLRHMLTSMYIEGVKKGELKKLKIKSANDYLYSFIETAIFQLVVIRRKNLKEFRETVHFAVKQLTL
jgi:predicted regulator of Ras-like GTPase activity (Roadblock/LC7/MglB family)